VRGPHGYSGTAALVGILVGLVGCASSAVAPLGRVDDSGTRTVIERRIAKAPGRAAPDSRPARHVVEKGDTLYAIAWRYGIDYRRLAKWNGFGPPFTIYPGQSIRLYPPADSRTASLSPSGSGARKPDAPAARTGTDRAASGGDANGQDMLDGWRWPTEGEVTRTFSQSGGKGIDVAGEPGQPVYAAADGRVVYSGGGLIGYGELIIIKHNQRYLSAYAHNNKSYVQEGDTVAGGQQIAEMGRTGTDRVKLHFEIRLDGKPVDPLAYLPG